jgi:hypothetical protein
MAEKKLFDTLLGEIVDPDPAPAVLDPFSKQGGRRKKKQAFSAHHDFTKVDPKPHAAASCTPEAVKLEIECPHCNKKCRNPFVLESHLLSHTGENILQKFDRCVGVSFFPSFLKFYWDIRKTIHDIRYDNRVKA